MNDLGREKLIAAAMSGVKQIKGAYRNKQNGRCAMGVLGVTEEGMSNEQKICEHYEIGTLGDRICELCLTTMPELRLIIHYNDFHGLDFLTIARKI